MQSSMLLVAPAAHGADTRSSAWIITFHSRQPRVRRAAAGWGETVDLNQMVALLTWATLLCGMRPQHALLCFPALLAFFAASLFLRLYFIALIVLSLDILLACAGYLGPGCISVNIWPCRRIGRY